MSKHNKSTGIRIIGGHWRGRKLPVLDIAGLRPTADRVRETLFNWLMFDISGSRCLDLFAGSGALGLECLSRGAAFVQFVDASEMVRVSIEDNLKQFQVPAEQAAVVRADASAYVSQSPVRQFELVFLDPPFESDVLCEVIHKLEQNNWLSDSALIYIEQPVKQEMAEIPANWQLLKQGKTSQSDYRLYAREASGIPE